LCCPIPSVTAPDIRRRDDVHWHRDRALLIAALALLGIVIASPVTTSADSSKTAHIYGTKIGIMFRASPDDWNSRLGPAGYDGDLLVLQCQVIGAPIGPHNNRTWYFATSRFGSGWLPDHFTDTSIRASQWLPGLQQCRKLNSTQANPEYNRSAAVAWALAHAADPQRSEGLCTIFVSQALWAGGFPRSAEWHEGAWASRIVSGLLDYLQRTASVTKYDITPNLSTNAVPQAVAGDIIAYDWNNDGVLDHTSFVVDLVRQYPEVSDWGQVDHSLVAKAIPVVAPRKRGWTWSAKDNRWQQAVPGQQNMRAYLYHINGGYFVPNY
jgi:hypothetical protein